MINLSWNSGISFLKNTAGCRRFSEKRAIPPTLHMQAAVWKLKKAYFKLVMSLINLYFIQFSLLCVINWGKKMTRLVQDLRF